MGNYTFRQRFVQRGKRDPILAQLPIRSIWKSVSCWETASMWIFFFQATGKKMLLQHFVNMSDLHNRLQPTVRQRNLHDFFNNSCNQFENRCDYRASAFLVDQEAPSSQCVDHTTVRFFHLHPSFIVLYPFRPNFWLNAGAIPRKRSKAKISFLGPRASVKACSKHLLLATLITEDRHLEYPVGQRCTKRWKNHAPSDLAICYTAIDFCSIWLNACLHFNDLHHTVHLCLDLSHPHKHKQDGTYAYLITHTHTRNPNCFKKTGFLMFCKRRFVGKLFIMFICKRQCWTSVPSFDSMACGQNNVRHCCYCSFLPLIIIPLQYLLLTVNSTISIKSIQANYIYKNAA